MAEPAPLRALVADELSIAVDPRVSAMAAAIAARHKGASGVLFYGSCLREASFDGLMLDFYLIVESYVQAFDKAWLARANQLLPPNVFPFQYDGLAAKYAVLSADDFHRLNGPEADTVSVWARFAQPSRLVWVSDAAARDRIVTAVARAAPTLFALTTPLSRHPEGDPGSGSPSKPDQESVLDIWRTGFARTYGAELRAERANRPGSVVDSDPARYERFGQSILAAGPPAPALSAAAAQRRWAALRRRGKLLTLARLAKASATFADGIDYLAWKISRHSGQPIALKPWQRRWPILGALTLLPRLIAKGAIR